MYETNVTPERTLLCYAIAVLTALSTGLGVQLLTGIASGEVGRAFSRELVDLGLYWLVALPICYVVAGVLGYVGPVRTWRWIVTMIAVQSVYMLISAGSSLSLLPFALAMTAVIAVPGLVTGWLGGLIRRHRDAPANG
jgi:hypothetical protein